MLKWTLGCCTVKGFKSMALLGTLASPQMLLLGTGNSNLGPSSPLWIFFTGQEILTWDLVSDLVSTHLAEGAGEVLGPKRRGFFAVLPTLKTTPNLAGGV